MLSEAGERRGCERRDEKGLINVYQVTVRAKSSVCYLYSRVTIDNYQVYILKS
jgi:hypothetical protein